MSDEELAKVINRSSLSYPALLIFWDPASFRTGELRAHTAYWETIVGDSSTVQQAQVLDWLRNSVSVYYFQHFRGLGEVVQRGSIRFGPTATLSLSSYRILLAIC